MSIFTSNQKIGDIVAKFPNASEVLKEYKIDFCCGGNRPLITAIREQDLDEEKVIGKINTLYEDFKNKNNLEGKNWVEAPFGELVEHILNVHHAYLHENLPKIGELTAKILRVHGNSHPELFKVHKLFNSIKTELESHLIKEETIQYPAIREYEKTRRIADLDNAIKIIKELEEEHTGAGDILKELRKVTEDYAIPDDVCPTFRLTYDKLQEMETDLFQHIHLENNILFPRLFALKAN
jgi:regulator of cell morphogenesis and NO signaling